jgi:ABC-type nickel/cobalt efflux system permease component RcnA
MVSVFDATAPASGILGFRDGTFPDRIGWKEITAAARSGATLSRSSVPAASVSDELLKYPTNLLQSPLSVTHASASFDSSGSAPAPACPGAATGTPKAAGSAFASLITWKLTPALLGASLLLAFAFGVLHALGPGHGKTITAAYLVGSGAKLRQAVGVGVAVASMHTLSVLALGVLAVVLSASFPAERIYPWLTVVTGTIALSLGGALLVMRIRALRRGKDLHGHTHPWDANEHEDGAPARLGVGIEDRTDSPELALVGASLGSGETWGSSWGGGGRGAEPGHDGVHGHDHVGHDHVGHGHVGHGHDHHHGGVDGHGMLHGRVEGADSGSPATGAEARPAPVSRPRLAALAVSGGLLPSPTALVVMLAAIGAHRVVYGLSLIVAFSVGLASALIAIALLALRARGMVDRRLGTSAARVLPVLSALVIVGFGLFFLTKGVLQVGL